jgi:ABC-2 type transport system ATP-binding protein
MEVISAGGLTKMYRRFEKGEGFRGSVKSLFVRRTLMVTAVDRFDLSVHAGEFVGLIGPNGAGKTTVTKMLTGIIAPTSGELNVLGYRPNRLEDAFKRQYAVVMGQKSGLFPDLSAADAFLLMKKLYGVPEAECRERVDYLVDLFSARERLNVQVRTLSLGERMKMELIAALIHNPKVLFLDEPTIGLDAVMQKQVRAFLQRVNRDVGTTILLTSHYMEDIRSLCPRCVVIAGGRKLYDGDTEALFDRYQTRRLITVRFPAETDFLPDGTIDLLERSPQHLKFLAPRAEAQTILRELLTAVEVSDIAVEEEDIGSVVARIYGEAAR